tara:strand:+ start:832 stop:1602 length:771 start_codon:yes stop_codon:yes gene_type:complete
MANKIDTEPLLDGEGVGAVPIGKTNAGFLYESSLIKSLRNQGFTVSDPAGADSAKADLELTKGANIVKFELKEKLSADFAQMNFDFDTTRKEFYIDKTKTTAKKEAAQTMIGIAESYGIIRQANAHWQPKKNMPAKFVLPPNATFKERDKSRKLDLKRFPDKYLGQGFGPAQEVERYYNSKDTYYIQIKGKGLYYMGKDPEKYGCPRFSDSCADSSIRIRIKTNSASKGRWSFLMALKISRLRPSNMNLDLDASFL